MINYYTITIINTVINTMTAIFSWFLDCHHLPMILDICYY